MFHVEQLETGPFSLENRTRKNFCKIQTKTKGARTLMRNQIESAIKELSGKTEKASHQDEAMKYAQAILNLANALAVLENMEQ